MPTPTVHTWSSLPTDRPMPGIARQRIIGAQAMISRVHLDKGTYVPAHRHDNEQVAVVLAGRIRFRLGEDGQRSETLTAGQALLLPGGALHDAEALEDCIILDVFSPPSERTGIDRD